MGCSRRVIKAIIAGANALMLIAMAFAAALAFQHIEKTDLSIYVKVVKANAVYQTLVAIIIFVIFTTIIGCALACYDTRWFRVTYFIFLLICFVLEIISIVFALKNAPKIVADVGKRWGEFPKETLYVEEHLDCCGFEKINESRGESCYNIGKKDFPCKDKIVKIIDKNIVYVEYAGIGLLALEVILFGLSCYWACCYKEELEESTTLGGYLT